jgi:hypothetical protein
MLQILDSKGTSTGEKFHFRTKVFNDKHPVWNQVNKIRKSHGQLFLLGSTSPASFSERLGFWSDVNNFV